jgi:hypothetical protein
MPIHEIALRGRLATYFFKEAQKALKECHEHMYSAELRANMSGTVKAERMDE